MPRAPSLAALLVALPLAALAQDAPVRCEVASVTDHAATDGAWKATPGAAGGAFTLTPILAPETCTAAGCTTYTSGWVMVADEGGAYTCWSGMTPDAVVCDLMGSGQALINLAAGTAMIVRYEGFTFGLPDSRVSVALATCAAG